MRKSVILVVLATSIGFAFAAQAHDHRKSLDDRATARTEYNSGYRSHDERRESCDRMSRSHDERRERGEARRHRDRDDLR